MQAIPRPDSLSVFSKTTNRAYEPASRAHNLCTSAHRTENLVYQCKKLLRCLQTVIPFLDNAPLKNMPTPGHIGIVGKEPLKAKPGTIPVPQLQNGLARYHGPQ